MLSRRHFIGGIASIIAAQKAPAYITKSSIAARNIDYSSQEQPSMNPYVSNGLIAMWDAELNIGWGQHDENATFWKDLSGNNYDLIAPQVYEWGQNYCDLSAGNSFSGKAEVLEQATTEFVGCFTAPYVYSTSTDMGVEFGNRGVGSVFLTGIDNGSNDIVVVFRVKNDYGRSYYRKVGPYPSDARTRYVNRITSFSAYGLVNPNANWDLCTVSVDGVRRAGTNDNYWSSPNSIPTNEILVGSNGGKTDIRLCCVRIYARALTEEETAFNAAIDQLRFI